ncbi:MAG: hypothetical protein Q9181_006291 [Wetmoreana brouardii]
MACNGSSSAELELQLLVTSEALSSFNRKTKTWLGLDFENRSTARHRGLQTMFHYLWLVINCNHDPAFLSREDVGILLAHLRCVFQGYRPHIPKTLFSSQHRRTRGASSDTMLESALWGSGRPIVAPEVIVLVALKKSALAIITIIAVLRAGGAYVPIDPSWSLEYVRHILDNTSATAILYSAGSAASYSDLSQRVVEITEEWWSKGTSGVYLAGVIGWYDADGSIRMKGRKDRQGRRAYGLIQARLKINAPA